MKVRSLLPLLLAVVSAVPLLGQEPLPASTEALHATLAKLRELTQSELSEVLLKAESGNREAQYWLALIYEEGQLVPKDPAAFRDWMLKSAQQGYAPAQAGMGRIYLSKSKGSSIVSDYGDADRWLRLAALQGDAESQFWLGTGYEQGWFGVTDYREALRWLRKAAQQGLPDAQFCLGQMYEDGEGVPESAIVAARWYRRAADHSPSWLGGVWEAEGKLADMYRDDTLPRDDVQAYMWLAVVSSTLDPPTDVGIKKISRRMTKAQIVEGQRRADDWIKRHPLKTQNLAQAEQVEDARYRVREINWSGIKAVPFEQIISTSQIRAEDILDTSKVRDTVEAVRRLYAANGYPTASVVPQVQVHEAGHWVSLHFSVVEGAQSP